MAVGVVSVMLLAGCGDDGDESSSTTVAPTTSTTLSQVQLDEQKAQRVVLTVADLPGYSIDPPEADNPEGTAAINACVNNDPVFVALGEDGDPRGAVSPDFSKGETITVSSAVTFADTEDQAKATLTAVAAAPFAACFSRAAAEELRREPGLSNVTVTTAKLPAATVGDQSVGYRSTIRFRAGGTSVTSYTDLALVRSGRAVSGLQAASATTAFPEAERTRLLTTIAGRMAAP